MELRTPRRTQATSPVAELVKIVGGGVVGIALALAFLKYGWKHAWFDRDAPPPVTEEVSSLPSPANLSTDALDPAPLPSAPRRREKQPLPSPEAQVRIRREIDALFAEQLSRALSAEPQQKLATQIYELADQTRSQPDDRFVLLSTAAELAVEAGDLPLMTSLTNVLGAEYAYDAAEAQESFLRQYAARADDPAEIRLLVQHVKAAIAEALAEDRYDAALALADATLAACERPAGAEVRPLVQFGRDRLALMLSRWPAYQAARQTLKTAPDDAAANLVAGRWLCLEKGQWKRGLAHLARAGDHPLADAARHDRAASMLPTPDAAQALKLADRWYDLGMQDEADRGFLAVAYYWYSHSHAALTGEDAPRVQHRQDAIAQDLEARRLLEMAAAP